MNWSFWLILVPTICYGLAAVVYGLQRNWPLAVVYAGYAFANCGLLALDLRLN
jgi:uncharacterized protein involved in cysteine biosynthesis